MKYDSLKHHRQSIHLPNYDYTQPGAYFVIIVTWQRKFTFGEFVGEEIRLMVAGKIAFREWSRLPNRFPFLILNEFVVMPNHIHGIVVITGTDAADVGAGRGAAGSSQDIEPEFNPLRPYKDPQPRVTPGSLGAIIRAYKSSVTLRYNRTRFSNGEPLWQRNYYEHIIRDDEDWERIRFYIQTNPLHWSQDNENPAALVTHGTKSIATITHNPVLK